MNRLNSPYLAALCLIAFVALSLYSYNSGWQHGYEVTEFSVLRHHSRHCDDKCAATIESLFHIQDGEIGKPVVLFGGDK